MTLKGQDGKLVTFVAGPEVKNLAQVAKGDVVTMAYIEAVAAKLQKTDNKTRSRVVTPFEKRAERRPEARRRRGREREGGRLRRGGSTPRPARSR